MKNETRTKTNKQKILYAINNQFYFLSNSKKNNLGLLLLK